MAQMPLMTDEKVLFPAVEYHIYRFTHPDAGVTIVAHDLIVPEGIPRRSLQEQLYREDVAATDPEQAALQDRALRAAVFEDLYDLLRYVAHTDRLKAEQPPSNGTGRA